MKVLIVGGVAGGASAAARIRRLDEYAQSNVRTEGEYQRGHLNGFRNIPLDDLREHLDELERDKPVYVNCQTGLRSYLACRLLTQYGFTCAHLSGGYSFYQVVTQEQQTARSAYPCGMEKL